MKRLAFLFFITGLSVILWVVMGISGGADAASLTQEPTPIPNLSISDEYCIGCHGQPGQTFQLEDGTEWDLYVDPQEHANSIHGSQGYACVQCHADVGEYPHPPFSAANAREATIQLNQVCQRCHIAQYELAHDSVHSQALEEGNRSAAVCSDCHTAHAVQDWVDEETGEALPEARIRIPQTCAQCHSTIYETYLTSVHGSALNEQNNPDVPTCIDCHGVHNIEDPTTAQFRLASPRLCAGCHTDPAVMTKYGISTEVLETYVADFHGTTVAIFEKQSPDAETNKPVCYDCHGVHDIKRADDPEKGLQVKENMLATCQKCHPDAQENFPTAWLSHYIPSPEKYPIVYYVDLFYRFFIPMVLGGMALLVVMDLSRRAVTTRRTRQAVKPSPGTPEAEPTLEEALPEAMPEVAGLATVEFEQDKKPAPGEIAPEGEPAEYTKSAGEETPQDEVAAQEQTDKEPIQGETPDQPFADEALSDQPLPPSPAEQNNLQNAAEEQIGEDDLESNETDRQEPDHG